jgi:amidase
MKFSEYIQYDGIGLADLIRRKEITPHELLETTIRTIEELNPSLNAVVNKMYDHARRYVDKGLPEAPFSGVPFLLKDLLADYAGIPTSAAWKHHNNVIPDRDAEIVVRQKNAGLIIVGKTALPELAASWNTESELFGNTYNPWNKKYGSGTSSGGSAVAVAAGMVPMAHGGDGGGSIRCPASCCGVVGLKPSRGRNPVGPADGDRWYGMVVEHVLTRSVRDTASMLDVTSGPEIGSFINPAPKDRIFLEDVGVNPGKLRIAFSTKAPYGAQTHPDCIAAVEKTAKLCIELGHEVEEDSPLLPDNGFEALCNVLMPEFAADVN